MGSPCSSSRVVGRCDARVGSRSESARPAVVRDQVGVAFLEVGVDQRQVVRFCKVQYADTFFVAFSETFAARRH